MNQSSCVHKSSKSIEDKMSLEYSTANDYGIKSTDMLAFEFKSWQQKILAERMIVNKKNALKIGS